MNEAVQTVAELPPEAIYIALAYMILFAQGFNSNV